jgi:hypothetical protein
MPYKTFNSWLFDGNPKSKIPSGDGIPDLLKYNSPITNQYLIGMFLNQGKLNHFLNEFFNNIGLYYMDKKEMFYFIKKCVIDFKIQRKNLPFIPWTKNTKLFEALRKKTPTLKKHDVSLLCDIIDKSEIKEEVYYSLGLEKQESIKKQKGMKKETKKERPTIKEFLESNFKIMELNKKSTP